jgi:hypothetical protein
MTWEEFRGSLKGETPPAMPSLLTALWWEAKGDWSRAHEIAQDVASPEGAWVHAYLHRKEGDEGNADYWYRQAGKTRSRLPIETEWEQIAQALLSRPHLPAK